ncbi:MAG TPA: esterase-like activity of phytase family protein, partial [Hyphomonadaceae bacterium]
MVRAAATNYQAGRLSDYLSALSERSCPQGTRSAAPQAISIRTAPAELKAINPLRSELTFVAGFHITSPDRRFGGLSGLDLLDDGSLLAVSDVGNFVWIDVAPDGVTPVGARISKMRDAAGALLANAADGDAEGLAVKGGMALVSFEFNHRILAFDLGKCGAAARGAPIAFGPYGLPLTQAFAYSGLSYDENKGAEALGITDDWYVFAGSEARFNEQSMMSARPIEAEPDFDLRVGANAPDFAGMDVLPAPYEGKDARTFMLYRSFSQLSGAAISIIETDFRRHLDKGGFFRQFRGEIDERSHNWFVETGWREFAKL